MKRALDMDLFNLFSAIPSATSETSFSAIPLSAHRKDFLAKGADGAPVFLLHDASEPRYVPGVQFRYLNAQFHTTCDVRVNEDNLQGQFALVKCDDSVPELHEIFVRCLAAAIEELPTISGTKELSARIQELLDLFKALAEPSGKEISGLWAELYVIANCADKSAAMAAWREDPFDRFDFSWSKKYLEVKSSVSPVRIHEFSLEQLMKPLKGAGYVASLLLQSLNGGAGVVDLAKSIDFSLKDAPGLKQKLWKNIAKSLGNDFSEKLDKRFDLSYADRWLRVFAMDDVPKPDLPNDPRITSIRFSTDLTTVESSLGKASTSILRDIFSGHL